MSNNPNNDPDLNQVIQSPCNLNLFIYFLLSCLLFAIGFKVTFFSDFEDEESLANRWPWLGPLFLFVGTILAMHTLNSVRNKNKAQMSSGESDSDLFPPEASSEPMEIETNHTAPYQNLPPSYTSALHSDSNVYVSLPLNESDACTSRSRPSIQTNSTSANRSTNYNSFAANHASHHTNHPTNSHPIHRNSLNGFDFERPQPVTERSQYHPLTVDLPPAYNDIIK